MQYSYTSSFAQVDYEKRVDFDKLRKERVEKVQTLMKQKNLDAIITWKIENVRYLSSVRVMLWPMHGGPTHYCAILPKDKNPILLVSGGDFERCKIKMPWIREIYPIPIMEEDGLIDSAVSTSFKSIFHEHGLQNGKIGLDAISFPVYESFRRYFPQVSFVSADMLLKEARAIKTEEEIRLIDEATVMTEAGIMAAINAIQPGITEYEVAAEYMRVIFAMGAETLHTAQPYVVSGEHLAPPYRLATDKRIRYGDMVFIDTGACYNGYFSDVGRTVICGTPSRKQKEIYTAVYESLMATIKAIKPGAKTSEVTKACVEKAAEFGYDRSFLLLFIGHGVGIAPIEPPFIGEPTVSRVREVELKPNMILAIEPFIYVHGIKGGGGVRIEDLILVTDTGNEVLSRLPYDERLLMA